MTESREDIVNRHVSEQVRRLRMAYPMTQLELGKAIGLKAHGTVGQMERGDAQISAGRLQAIAEALDADITEFYPSRPSRSNTKPTRAARRRA